MSTQDLIVEIGTEELPPIALKSLAEAFHKNLVSLVAEQKLGFSNSEVYATPRRLAVMLYGLELQQADQTSRRLGPAVAAAYDADGNVTKAAEGFARSCGVAVTELDTFNTDKGDRLGMDVVAQGQATAELLPDIINKAVNQIPIPKAMRWGNYSDSFVRPVKWLVVLHGDTVVPMQLFNITSGNQSRGHRFMSSAPVTLAHASDYVPSLKAAKVIVSQKERMQMIRNQVKAVANEHGFVAVMEESLVEEVSALVEWPVALLGNFEEAFLSVPKEALISTMSKNQKYFHLENAAGDLVPHFITLANIESPDPAVIISGNEKVIRPRLADAKFFYEQDSKRSLTSCAKILESVVFQNKLGSIAQKCQRVAVVAASLAKYLDADSAHVAIAATLCKADLVTDMVNEFPNLQGIMGKYYAQKEGLPDEVCVALEEVYQPRHAGDALPQSKVGICLAIADRLDTLVGIFGIQQTPSGNKDPFALRRAALGIINICIEHKLDLDLRTLIDDSLAAYDESEFDSNLTEQLLTFFNSRLKALAIESGFSAPEFSAVESLALTVPYDVWLRLQAVAEFTKLPQALILAESNKRVANILSKNLQPGSNTDVSVSLLSEPAEQALHEAMQSVRPSVDSACDAKLYVEAFAALVSLTTAIDGFFENVMVMDEDSRVQSNRLGLLFQLRSLFLSVADISRLQK
ncbi:MAG: glycine--tRNA ligase subunit beta [Gammaproteobacteria bacterium]|nr:glycine--tRNA ligase subunit beta [Gammaproteobacteria bacterium]NNJ73264.1 glycine--tRNA ligase subunit beta [Enterobacterales bacterium]